MYRFSHKDFGLRSQIKIRHQRTIVRLRIILIWRLAKIFMTKSVSIEGMSDHVHLFAKLRASESISKAIGELKGSSSKWINEKKLYDGHFSWQAGFGAFSVSESQINKIARYIEYQKNIIRYNHSKRNLLQFWNNITSSMILFTFGSNICREKNCRPFGALGEDVNIPEAKAIGYMLSAFGARKQSNYSYKPEAKAIGYML